MALNKNLEEWFYKKIENKKTIGIKELNEITIVIPTYERQDFILRQLIYWHGSGIKLLILDGSISPLPGKILDFVNPLKNFTYLHLVNSYEERLNKAINYIETPYVASLSDDEFFLKSSLKKLANRLDQDKNLSGCIGQSLRFNWLRDTDEIDYSRGYPHSGFRADHTEILERLKYGMNPYNAATAYGLLRKDVWLEGWGKIEKYSSLYVSEIYQAFVTYVYGKYIAIDDLYWLRSDENAPVEINNGDRQFEFDQWWIGKDFLSEKNNFLNRLEKVILNQTESNPHEAKSILLESINSYLEFSTSKLNKMRKLLTKILRIVLPHMVYHYLKNRVTQNKFSKNYNSKYQWQKFLESENYLNKEKEMEEIELLVKEFTLCRSK